MNNERRRSRRNQFAPSRQRMVDPDAWNPDNESSPQPAAEGLPALPIPTPSSTFNDDALQPLITQPADPVAAAIARRQNTVVTVTSTQFAGSVDPNANSQNSDGIPIVTIAVSASVGVFLAVSIVGCWWWFCKRPYSRRHYKPSVRPSHKNQTSTSSVAPLKGSGTKPPGPHASPRSREKPAGPNPPAPPSHARSTSGGPPNGREQQQQRRPGQPALPPPAVLPASASTTPPSTNTPPNAKRRSPPSSTQTSPSGRSDSLTASPASTLVEEPSTPKNGIGKAGPPKPSNYTPLKPSPLALGAERAKPKEKPKEKSKVNEWGTGFPVRTSGSAPSSPTRSSSSGHGHETTEQAVPPPVPPVPSATNAGRRSANLLAIPEPAAQFESKRDRISVLSDSSYYALDDEDDRGQHVYMGVAIGGDDPSPVPEEYFSPKYGEDEQQHGGGRMQGQQDDYFSGRQGTTYGGYGQHYAPSQYGSQGGYGYGYPSNQQSYRR